MILRKIKHMIFRLSTEEKVLAAGALTVLICAFFPWYSITYLGGNSLTLSGFAGDLGVIGFIIFLFNIITLTFLMSEHLGFKMPHFGYKKEQILLLLTSQSAFLLLLTIAIYTKRSLEYTSSELRFGLYASLIGACLGAFAAFAQIKKLQKKNTEEIFDHNQENAEMDEDENEIEYAVGTSKKFGEIKNNIEPKSNFQKKSKKTDEKINQKNFFYDETPAVETRHSADEVKASLAKSAASSNHDTSDINVVDEHVRPEIIVGDADLRPETIDDEIDLELDKPNEQRNYFMRDAGVIHTSDNPTPPVEAIHESSQVIHELSLIDESPDDIVRGGHTSHAVETRFGASNLGASDNSEPASVIKVDMESIKIVEKPENNNVETQNFASENNVSSNPYDKSIKKPVNQNMNMSFYDDL